MENLQQQFNKIQEELVNRNLRCVVDPNGRYVGTWVSGVAIEYNAGTLPVAVKLIADNKNEGVQEVLDSWVVENYGADSFIEKRKTKTSTLVNFLPNLTSDEFMDVVSLVSETEFNLEYNFGSKVKRGEIPTFNVSKENTYLQIAKRIQFAVDNNDSGVLNRDLMDKLDDTIVIAQSLKHRDTDCKSWREHIVPCDFLYREGIEMYREGKSLYEIAVMLQHNLKIVMITDEEAKRLDGELCLKTDMPEDWIIGDSIFARLSFAGIEIVDL